MEIRIAAYELYNMLDSNHGLAHTNEQYIIRRYIGNRLKKPYSITRDMVTMEYVCKEEDQERCTKLV